MLKRMSFVLILLALAGCSNRGYQLDSDVATIVKLIIGVAVLVAVFAAFAAILIRDSSERRFTAGLVALVAVVVGALFLLVLVA